MGRRIRQRLHRAILAASLSLIGSLVVGVGCSRTGLNECLEEGARRGCRNGCGVGNQVCLNGTWSVCDAQATRSCQNACGSGSQLCRAGLWEDCLNPPVQVPCSNACGEGTASCTDGTQGTCQVPPVELPCEGGCGPGTQRCEAGVVGECVPLRTERPCSTICGEGREVCVDGAWVDCDAPSPQAPRLDVVVRDFRESHPDFEPAVLTVDPGIAGEFLDAEGAPSYAPGPFGSSPTTSGIENFRQWYRDVPGVNQRTSQTIVLRESGNGTFVYENPEFFPIDDQLFGNEGREHNYHFTVELETRFRYQGGETFSFRGDDDVFVYINGRKVIDIGGIHAALSASVSLDVEAARLGLVQGEIYPLKLFFAERHVTGSSFRIETTIAEWNECG